MEEAKQEVDIPPSPPSKKLKLDSMDDASERKGDPPVSEKQSNEVKKEATPNTESKKHPAEDVNDPVPCKKLKPDDSTTSSIESKNENRKTEDFVLDKQTAAREQKAIATKKKEETVKENENNVAANSTTETPTVEAMKVVSAEVETASPKLESVGSKETKIEKEANQTQLSNEENATKKEILRNDDGPTTSSKSPEVKHGEAKSETKPSPVKVLKKLPGLNPIKAIGNVPLQVNTDIGAMGAPANRATISPVQASSGRNPTSPGNPRPHLSPGNSRPQLSPGNPRPQLSPGNSRPQLSPGNPRPQLSPGNSRPHLSPGNPRPQLSPGNSRPQLSPGNPRTQLSPANQMGGATASITPVRNKSPIAHLQRVGALTVSPVKQKSPQGVSISRQAKEVDMSPFLSGEVTISALTQQGLSITPAQPRLSAEIRSQIPEGISITAVPSSSKSPLSAQFKAKSPVRQPMPRQQKPQKISPPKAVAQQLRSQVPQPQQIRRPVPARPTARNALPEPGMIGRLVRTPSRQPAPRILENKAPATPLPGEQLKSLLSQKPAETSPSQVVKTEKPLALSEQKPAVKPEVPLASEKAKDELAQPKPMTSQLKAKTPEPAFAPGEKSNQVEKSKEVEKMDVSTKDENKEKPNENKTAKIKDEEKENEKKADNEKMKEEEEGESSSEDESDDESEEEKEENSKDSKPTKSSRKKAGTPATTPARALRTRKLNIGTNVAVKLDRIDDELEDGALPPWNLKKLNKSAGNSDAESGDASDDNSNSQDSKVSTSLAPGEAETPKRRGRPRKTHSPVRDVEDYTSHESLHEALKKIIADERLEPADSDLEDEEEKDEPEGRRETKMLLAAIPFFSRRGGRAGMKGKAIGKNNQFDNHVVEKLEHDRRFRTEMLKQYQDDVKKREEKRLEKIADNEKKKDERTKAALERKEKMKLKAEERRRKYVEQKTARLEEAKKREEARKLRASLNSVQNFDDDTRMSFPPTPGTPAWKNTSVKFESLEDGEKSESKGKRGKMETIDFDSQKEFPVQGLAEYQWPLQGGEHFMIQEQVAAYLGVKSFKRKYPDLKRRGLEPEERTYICDSGLVSEAMIELGLTAVESTDIMDIMFVDFPEKYEEVKKYSREKQARELIDRQRAFYDTTMSEQTSKDLKETLVEATALWNAQFNKLRRETRQCALDLQTFVVHYPAKANPKPTPKMGHYPVAILPGQYCDYYKEYTSTELKYMPLNTVLYGPLLPNEPYADELSYSDQTDSEGDSDSDTSSSGSSSNDSSSSSSGESSSEDEDAPKPLPKSPAPKKQAPQGNKASDSTSGKASGSTSGNKAGDSTQGHKANDNGEVLTPVKEGNGGKMDEPMEVEPSKEAPSTPRNCKACDRDETAGEMIRCGKCVRYLHPPCLDLPLEMLPHMRLYEWQCSDCKSCVSCQLAQDDDKMLFCDLCDRGYHNYCIGLDKIPTGRWHCKVCSVCSVCKTTEPNPEWEHEVKKGPKGQSMYQRTLCTPCSKSSADSNSRPQRR